MLQNSTQLATVVIVPRPDERGQACTLHAGSSKGSGKPVL